MALADAINTIDKRQIRFYLGRLSDDDMAGVDAAITSHLGYEIAWCMEAP
jgi:mRNA-degrading endonuclease toxin of MazEF toxin-antitoxin module